MRKKEEINKICGKRLRELISASNLTQYEFADKINYTEQQVSYMVNGKRRITPDAAMRIAEMFPPTRFEWLLGLDDFKTPFEIKLNKPIKKAFEILCTRDYIIRFAPVLGFEFVEHEFSKTKGWKASSNDEYAKLSDEDREKVIQEHLLFEKIHENEKYEFKFKGKTIAKCSEAEFCALAEEVGNFLRFKLYEFTKKQGDLETYTAKINREDM